MVQSRIVYVTGDDEIDRILNDISQRLDTIEGLRPDLDAGYYALDSDKAISTGDPIDIDDVSITRGSIIITSTSGNTITITGDSITILDVAGNSIVLDSEVITFYDINNALVHKIGTWT